MSEPEGRRDEEPPAGARPLDQHLGVFFRDPSLWPVLVVSALIFVTLGASALALALRERNLFAAGALAVLLVVSGDLVQRDLRRRRLGLASRALLALWALSALAAALAVHLGAL
jgi:hypothetical protein